MVGTWRRHRGHRVTGGLGGRVARRLAERGVDQRLVVRDPGRAPPMRLAEFLDRNPDSYRHLAAGPGAPGPGDHPPA